MLPCVPGLENETVLGTLSDISNRLYIVVFLSLLNILDLKVKDVHMNT